MQEFQRVTENPPFQDLMYLCMHCKQKRTAEGRDPARAVMQDGG